MIAPHRAPWWLPGGHAQTVWPALRARSHDRADPPRHQRTRWTTPDGDFIDVDELRDPTPAGRALEQVPLLVLFHGLEGSSRSPYALAFADRARRAGWRFAVPHFRGCSGEINRAPRAYHSGDHEEIGWILARLKARHPGPVLAVGVSLGGNALLRWTQEAGSTAEPVVRAVAAVCAPLDLTASGHAIGRGLCRWLYTPMFLRTMKPKALAKLAQHPGLFDARRLREARTLHAFDDVFTAPLHGFRGVDDYWRRASALPRLGETRVPALVINPLNDPFVPARALPRAMPAGSRVTLWQPGAGGHVGFAEGAAPGDVRGLPDRVIGWMRAHLG